MHATRLRILVPILTGIVAGLVAVPTILESQRDPALVAARRDARSDDLAVRRRGTEALLAAGETGRAILRPLLEKQLEALAERVRGFGKSATGKRLRATAQSRLENARKAALAAVFDESSYYKRGKTVGQPKVDELVGAVRALYAHPVATLRTEVAAADRLCREIEFAFATADRLPKAVRPAGIPDAATALRALEESARPGDDAGSRWDETVAAAVTAAETEASPGEMQVVALLNDYRRMMGRRALAPHRALMRAARKHSQEMHDLGYFSHTSPTPGRASPGNRAKLEGYGGGCAENIARAANAEGAHRGWYGSPGHHRNMLGRHRVIGVGQSKQGGHWTQMFGGGNPQKADANAKVDWRTYVTRSRSVSERDVAARRALATWAARNGLVRAMEREAKHVLARSPDDAAMRELLGETQVDGAWRHPADVLARRGSTTERIKALGSPLAADDVYTRVRAVRALGNLFSPAAERVLIKQLGDSARAVRIEAAHWLMVGTGSRVDRALRKLLRDRDPAVRFFGAAALYRRGNATGIDAVLRALVDGSEIERAHAAEAVLFLAHEDFGYAFDAEPAARKAAAARATAWFAARAAANR